MQKILMGQRTLLFLRHRNLGSESMSVVKLMTYETEIMESRWNVFVFRHQFTADTIVDIQPCARCFVTLTEQFAKRQHVFIKLSEVLP